MQYIICFILRYLSNNKPETSFKKRFKDNYQLTSCQNSHRNFQHIALFFAKNTRIEFIYFFRFKKIFKKIIKQNKNNLWFYLNKNYPISKKSKNSRMGKGKGIFTRMCGRYAAGFRFLHINMIRHVQIYINKIIFFFRQNFNIKVSFRVEGPIMSSNYFLNTQLAVETYTLRKLWL